MRLRVTYDDPDELVADHQQQFARGGLFVRVAPPAQTQLFTPAALIIEYAGREVELEAQVVQVAPDAGVAVAFTPCEALEALVEQARRNAGAGGSPALHAFDSSEPGTAADAETAERMKQQRARNRERAAGIRSARFGTKDERQAIMRGSDRALQRHVLKNPGIGIDELILIARSPTTGPDLLKAIAERKEWTARPEIALALLRNPRSPLPVATRMVDIVSLSELRPIVRAATLRTPIVQAARRRLKT